MFKFVHIICTNSAKCVIVQSTCFSPDFNMLELGEKAARSVTVAEILRIFLKRGGGVSTLVSCFLLLKETW